MGQDEKSASCVYNFILYAWHRDDHDGMLRDLSPHMHPTIAIAFAESGRAGGTQVVLALDTIHENHIRCYLINLTRTREP